MIEIWDNKTTEAPSVQVGSVTVDLGEETPLQARLFQLVTNHPDVDAGLSMRAPVSAAIAEAFVAVLSEAIHVD